MSKWFRLLAIVLMAGFALVGCDTGTGGEEATEPVEDAAE